MDDLNKNAQKNMTASSSESHDGLSVKVKDIADKLKDAVNNLKKDEIPAKKVLFSSEVKEVMCTELQRKPSAEKTEPFRLPTDAAKRRAVLQKGMVQDKYPWKAWVYLLPTLILLLIFTVWPIINTVRIAFLNEYNGMSAIGGEKFDFGVKNFVTVVNWDPFLSSLSNTVILCVLTVPISTFLALLIAVCLNSIKALQRLLQTIFFLPYVTNSIAIGMVFAAMFNVVGNRIGFPNAIVESYGLVNSALRLFGIKPINWMNVGSTHAANIAVMTIYIVWKALPFKILILLGGLQSVNKQYYDAARVDGTSRSRIFWRITVPMLSPMIAYVVITGFIGGFKEYSSIVGIFGEKMGPGGDHTMNTIVGLIYDSIADANQGVASAAALILFAIIFLVTMVNLYVSKKKVHY